VLHANTTLVDRVDLATPAIAVLSTGYRPLGSCSRAAGWSAATLCIGPSRRIWRPRLLLLSEGELTKFTNREYHGSGQVRVYIVAQTCEQRRRPHNISYIKDGVVTQYTPIGTGGARCYTDERARPGFAGPANIQ
jgi:hypothetical protein